jgi:chromosome segregation ATPase
MKKLISIFFALVLGMAPVAVFAQTSVTTSVTTGVSASATLTTAETNAQNRANEEIQRRISNLNAMIARTNAMVNLSASEKSSLQTSLSTEVTNLTALQAQIDADTTLASLKTDIHSITTEYRVYMLVLPQARIAASADRIGTIVTDMQTLGAKLNTRINATTTAQTGSLQAAYTDMQTQISNANTQATAAVNATVSLTPDGGNATIAASNTAALKAGRAQIVTATGDLKAARADIATILKGLGVSVSASANATAQ